MLVIRSILIVMIINADDDADDDDDTFICRLLSLNQDSPLSLEGSPYFAPRLQFNTLPSRYLQSDHLHHQLYLMKYMQTLSNLPKVWVETALW